MRDAALNPARLILPALRWKPETGYRHEAARITEALELGVGGFILFGSLGASAADLRALTEELSRRAGRPLLLAADLERGAGQQAIDLTEFPPPRALASLDDPEAITSAALQTALEARGVGLNLVFAPVADLDALPDNPIIQTRSFGDDPAQVAAAVERWIQASHAGGVYNCAKHYPGHGRTTTDSHSILPVVDADRETLQTQDGRPFAAAVRAGVDAVMTAHVSYPALDPSGRPATFSGPILTDLRQRLGFQGLIVTDALIMEGALAGHGEAEAAVLAVRAGCDLLLYPKDPRAVRRALEGALRDGRLPASRLQEAIDRYRQAVQKVPLPATSEIAPQRSATGIADALLARGMLRGTAPVLGRRIALAVVDDDIYGAFAPGPSDFVEQALRSSGLDLSEEGDRVVLAFAEPRAAKGRAGFGPESIAALERLAPGAALVVLFAHPRLLVQIPGDAPVLLAWHRQRLMQEAVARWMEDRAGQ
jgi:beta-glucosidase